MNQQTQRKILTDSVALEKARKYCAYQERCQQEVRNKLYEWGLYTQSVEGIIAELITEGFINEERFAEEFANGKFKAKKWGKQKIGIELKRRKISEYCINKALDKIDNEDYNESLNKILQKKTKELKESDHFILKNKLAKYAISKGYESEIVWKILKEE